MSIFDTTPSLAEPYKQPGLIWWGNATNPNNLETNPGDGNPLPAWVNMTNAFSTLTANPVSTNGTYNQNGVATNKASVSFVSGSSVAYQISDPNSFLAVSTAFTFYAVVKLTSSTSTQMSIFAKGHSSASPDYLWQINRSTNDGSLSLYNSNGGTFVDSTIKIPTTTQFNVLVAVYDATTTTLNFFCNNVSLGITGTPSTLGSSTDPFIIGAQNTTTPVNYFNGQMADTLVFNCAHTTTQITKMTNYFKCKYGLNF